MGKMAAAVRFVTSAEGISIIVTKAKNAALGVYNTTLALANGFLNLFRISTYKNIAASIAQRVATIATMRRCCRCCDYTGRYTCGIGLSCCKSCLD